MQIEYPDFPPVALRSAMRPATIGAFYDTIRVAFETIQPEVDDRCYYVEVQHVDRIKDVPDAVRVIDRIKSEGEGLRDSPEQPSSSDTGHAHYYLFKEIFVQKRLIEVGGVWSFSGPPVYRPEVYRFDRVPLNDETRAFRSIFTRLLIALENCWRQGDAPNVPLLFELEICGRRLISMGCCPEFSWDENVRVVEADHAI